MDSDCWPGALSLHRGVLRLCVSWSKDVYCLNPLLRHSPPDKALACSWKQEITQSFLEARLTLESRSLLRSIIFITYWQSPFEIDSIIPTLPMKKTTKGFERQGQIYSTFFNTILIFSLVYIYKKNDYAWFLPSNMVGKDGGILPGNKMALKSKII